ncbi:MAG: protein translocase subunit SecF [Pyrinomonadaceae bacterium]
MIELFDKVNIDWMGKRKIFITISILLMLAGLVSTVARQATGGTPFNLGVDFKGGSVLTTKFKQDKMPPDDAVRSALQAVGINDPVLQHSLDKRDEVLIKIPLEEAPVSQDDQQPTANVPNNGQQKNQVDIGRAKVKQALDTFGAEASGDLAADENAIYKIVGTESVGAVAGGQLRNQAVAVTLMSLLGILFFIALRYDWTYASGAVIAVFHDVLVTIGIFSIFQWEINLPVIAALLTLVGFSVNDSIVIFDRIRENLKLNRRDSLYKLINESINQTLSRTIITAGLVLLSVIALVLFGGQVLFGFSIALLIGIINGTYSTFAIAAPIALWWEQLVNDGRDRPAQMAATQATFASAARKSVVRQKRDGNVQTAKR